MNNVRNDIMQHLHNLHTCNRLQQVIKRYSEALPDDLLIDRLLSPPKKGSSNLDLEEYLKACFTILWQASAGDWVHFQSKFKEEITASVRGTCLYTGMLCIQSSRAMY